MRKKHPAFSIVERKYPDALYLNFEDIRLYEFEKKDFARLDKVIALVGAKVLAVRRDTDRRRLGAFGIYVRNWMKDFNW